MRTLFARRYARSPAAVGTAEKAVGAALLLLTAGIVAACVVQVLTNRDYLFELSAADLPVVHDDAPEVAPALLADPGVKGWRAAGRVERFAADDMYVKIDGRADAFLQRGALELAFCSYTHEHDGGRSVDVYLYDMGTAANAEGVYLFEAPPEVPPVDVGQAGYQVGGAVFFWKGPVYVQVLPGSLDAGDADAALRIAEQVAARIP